MKSINVEETKKILNNVESGKNIEKTKEFIEDLVSGYNAWCSLEEYISKNDRLKEIIEAKRDELARDQCYSSAIILYEAISEMCESLHAE